MTAFPFPIISRNDNVSFPFPKVRKEFFIHVPVSKNWECYFYSRSQKLGMQFPSCSRSQNLECQFSIPVPVPKSPKVLPAHPCSNRPTTRALHNEMILARCCMCSGNRLSSSSICLLCVLFFVLPW